MRRLMIVVWLIAGTACSEPDQAAVSPSPSPSPPPLVDDEKLPLQIPAERGKIVSLAPQFTEALFAVGAGKRIVGVGAGETYPPQATVLPAIVLPGSTEPDIRRMIQLRPSLVLTAGFPAAPWKDALRAAGITVATFNASSVHDALRDISSVARLAGISGDRFIRRLTKEIRRLSPAADARKMKIFVESFYPPLTGSGRGGFVEDLIGSAGGELAAPPQPSETFQWSPPDVAAAGTRLYLAPFSTGVDEASIRSRPGFGTLASVPVAVIEDDLLFRPGPRMPLALRRIQQEAAAVA